jgi:hypothetical protein
MFHVSGFSFEFWADLIRSLHGLLSRNPEQKLRLLVRHLDQFRALDCFQGSGVRGSGLRVRVGI